MLSFFARSQKYLRSSVNRSLSIFFSNKFLSEKTPRKFTQITLSDLADWHNGNYRLLYVILENDQLILSKDERNFCSLTGVSTSLWHHSDLASLQKVKAAGEAEIIVMNGKIILASLNNRSGHYEPSGEHLKQMVEANFADNGFIDAEGKYADIVDVFKSLRP